ncbi:MAG: YbjQ family protein [Robiginitomaculum sp.]|nr:YbjQ family protein [Robiginitomaculum sp.]
MRNIEITNLETLPGRTIVKHLGMVQGNTVRAKHVGRDIMAGLKNIVGGELTGYTELLTESREESVSRMIEEARALGANAILNVRFSTSSVSAGASELYVYGTAVVVS